MTGKSVPCQNYSAAGTRGSLVVGVDTSLTCTGIAYNTGVLEVVKSTGKKTDTYEDRRRRLEKLAAQIVDVASPTGAALVVIEGPSYGSPSPSMWDRAHLWWSVYNTLRGYGLPVAVASPKSRMLYATGKGNADKMTVFEAAKDRLGGTWASFAGDDNRADAAWLCALGSAYLGHPLAVLPAPHRKALDGVHWPEPVSAP